MGTAVEELLERARADLRELQHVLAAIVVQEGGEIRVNGRVMAAITAGLVIERRDCLVTGDLLLEVPR